MNNLIESVLDVFFGKEKIVDIYKKDVKSMPQKESFSNINERMIPLTGGVVRRYHKIMIMNRRPEYAD